MKAKLGQNVIKYMWNTPNFLDLVFATNNLKFIIIYQLSTASHRGRDQG